jgi:di/tricarboxylate transporter
MTRLGGIFILCGIWAALYAASFLVPYFTPPEDFGFTRGMNRVELFFKYQLAAGAVSVVVWWMGNALSVRWQRWLSRMPALLAIGLFLLVVGVIVVSNMSDPGPTDYVPDPDRPVTAPAQPVPKAND